MLDYFHDPEALDKREELTAMSLAVGAVMRFAGRYADLLHEEAAREKDPGRRREFEEM